MARATKYFTFHDNSVIDGNGNEWLTEEILGNTAISDTDAIAIEITGTATSGETSFEIKVEPNGEYSAIAGIRADNFKIATSTSGINEVWLFDIGPYYSFRCRLAGVAGGYITIKSRISKYN